MEKYEIYRDSVDCLPSCQLEVQLYQNKIQDLADNREKLSNILKEVCIVLCFYGYYVMGCYSLGFTFTFCYCLPKDKLAYSVL